MTAARVYDFINAGGYIFYFVIDVGSYIGAGNVQFNRFSSITFIVVSGSIY